jgi:hypothetical protein
MVAAALLLAPASAPPSAAAQQIAPSSSPASSAAVPPSSPTRPKVILLSPPAAPPMVGEALVRLRSELMLEGFDAEVTQQPLGAPSEVRATLERIAPTLTAAATALVAVVPGPEPTAAELWVVDRLTGKTVVRRVRADPKAAAARAAEVLSVRAVELLRASFLELAITAARGDTAATAAVIGRR